MKHRSTPAFLMVCFFLQKTEITLEFFEDAILMDASFPPFLTFFLEAVRISRLSQSKIGKNSNGAKVAVGRLEALPGRFA